MALKTYNPTSAGQRHVVLVDRAHLWKGAPVKALTEGLTKSGGRSNTSHIASRRKGGGHKAAYRLDRLQASQVRCGGDGRASQYDPNHTAISR